VTFEVQKSFADVPALDIRWVPGGDPPALERIMRDEHSPYLDYQACCSERDMGLLGMRGRTVAGMCRIA